MRSKRAGLAVAALLSAVSAVGYSGGPAAAATTTEYVSDNCAFMNCSEGDLILNYHSVAVSGQGNPSGSFAQFYGNIYDLAGTYVSYNGATAVHYVYVFFKGQGDGAGQAVKNNAASANNCSTVDGYRVYYNSGYAGHSQSIPHYYGCGSSTNLDATLKNNNASLHFA
ncbi:hypothetical protein AB0E77_05750 [Streptomyces sp. NPDC032940]|uniref:hypothetical protein n=1 Tax=Streptomyces sp. NPDC032940 TaxID=3155366 RepID=UPI0033FCF126